MDICKNCENVIKIEWKFKEKDELFTFTKCRFLNDSFIVEKCSHFKAKPIKDNKDKEPIKKATKEGQTFEEHIEGCGICESTNPSKPKAKVKGEPPRCFTNFG